MFDLNTFGINEKGTLSFIVSNLYKLFENKHGFKITR